MSGLVFKAYNRLLRRYSNVVFAPILRTAPIATDPAAAATVYSVLDARNVNAYIVAAKSLLQHTPPVRLVVQSDGTLGPGHRRRLDNHFPGIQINVPQDCLNTIHRYAAGELSGLVPPLADCNLFIYYQLLNIALGFRDQPVIQLDSDIIFVKRPDFILEWMSGEHGECFHSDGGNGLAAKFESIGFQCRSVPVSRFNAGLFGVRRGPDIASIARVLRTIHEQEPAILNHWEAAQAIWAVLLDEFESPTCLEDLAPGYVGNGWRSYAEIQAQSTLVHFVGSTRFKDFTYVRLAKELIKQLKHSGPSSKPMRQPTPQVTVDSAASGGGST